jgi:hypothetical protein
MLSAEQPTNCTVKEELKAQWLKSLGYADDKSVIDCDPSASTITFAIDGEQVVRTVVECWTRVMGYHRPVASFNTGKKGEFAERVPFREPVGAPAPERDTRKGHVMRQFLSGI